MATSNHTVEVKVAPKIGVGLGTRLGLIAAALAAVLGPLSTLLEGNQTPEVITSLAVAAVALYKTLDIRGSQATAAITALTSQKMNQPILSASVDAKEVADAVASRLRARPIPNEGINIYGQQWPDTGQRWGGTAVGEAGPSSGSPGTPGHPITQPATQPGTQERPYPEATPPGFDGDDNATKEHEEYADDDEIDDTEAILGRDIPAALTVAVVDPIPTKDEGNYEARLAH